ncbi:MULTISPECIES: M24 family metallopeptidase [Pseudoalteromonas]|uniref:Xaa-Pro aminopeptidase n=1 Tax=Pseudoalteromonas amylolytica TaxID=1859457 RepID=A0A1S1MSD2_9GAMM|nr:MULTISPECIES: Xaa-Pro peptidase family protein [Pseudoalteromonas]OHU88070.1 Xaa-Pro aminopeptidase [Pseudoalteromonas sp. JW3]OHU91510.1 Xaa-Pro aminopeptidase [Pseudoalteromonas amylolytica]
MNAIYLHRQHQIKQQLKLQQIDNLLVFGFENIRYLSGFSGNAAYLLITSTSNYLITDYRYYERAKSEAHHCEVICRDRDTQTLGECIKGLLPSGLTGFDAAYITVPVWQEIHSQLQHVQITPIQGLIEAQRAIKDEWEINSIKKAAAIADIALADMLKLVSLGVTEKELATELDYKMKKLGSDGVSFDTILLFAKRSALPHGKPGDTKLNHQDLVLIDFGAVVNGYRSDMTRTFVFGEPTKQQQHMYDTVLCAQQAALANVKQGVSCHHLNHCSEEVLFAEGYQDYAGKGLGHGLGLFLHEVPFINSKTDYTLRAGNIITIEPGVYLPDLGGVRIEDDILVTESGFEYLTHAPKSFVLPS